MEDRRLVGSGLNTAASTARITGFRPLAPGRSISSMPYRFNLNGYPKPAELVQQHMALFKTTLDWDRALKSFQWRIEPDIKTIKQVMGPLLSKIALTSKHLTVELMGVSSIHKTYLITTCHVSCVFSGALHTENASSGPDSYKGPCPTSAAKLQLLLQLTLPVFPWYKTESEVATMEYLRLSTMVPIPRVYAFDSSVKNPMGFEWILMEKPTGQPYGQLIDKLDDAQKKEIMKSLTAHSKAVPRLQFDKIGSLYCNWDAQKTGYYLGPVVDLAFLQASRSIYPTERGSFPNVQTYFMAFLKLKIQEVSDPRSQQQAQGALDLLERIEDRGGKEATNEGDVHEAKASYELSRIIAVLERFQRIVSASTVLGREHVVTRLYKHELGKGTMFVNEKGSITGLMGWELYSTLPAFLFERITDMFPAAAGKAGPHILTDEQVDQILEAKDAARKPGVAMGRVIRVLAEYMFKVEEDVPGAERWVGKLEECGILN